MTLRVKLGATMAVLLLAWSARAGELAISRHVIAGGAGASGSAQRELRGTIGQPVAGASTSARYELRSGFWIPLTRDDGLFADGFED